MSIWKTPEQKPDPTKEILVEYMSAKGTPYYKVECGGINNMFHPKRWAYLSDIIAQADKAERWEKALMKIATASPRDKASTLIDIACIALTPELEEGTTNDK